MVREWGGGGDYSVVGRGYIHQVKLQGMSVYFFSYLRHLPRQQFHNKACDRELVTNPVHVQGFLVKVSGAN